jgi:hypothetical protein
VAFGPDDCGMWVSVVHDPKGKLTPELWQGCA